MIIVTKHKDSEITNKVYYKARCSKCNAEFIFSSDDISSEKRLNGTKWIACPECGECIYWSSNFTYTDMKTITKEEYNKIVNDHNVSEE